MFHVHFFSTIFSPAICSGLVILHSDSSGATEPPSAAVTREIYHCLFPVRLADSLPTSICITRQLRIFGTVPFLAFPNTFSVAKIDLLHSPSWIPARDLSPNYIALSPLIHSLETQDSSFSVSILFSISFRSELDPSTICPEHMVDGSATVDSVFFSSSAFDGFYSYSINPMLLI
jgi:hypothetical protein